jgi:hypothetical protein
MPEMIQATVASAAISASFLPPSAQARKMRQAAHLPMDQAGDLLEIIVLDGGSPLSLFSPLQRQGPTSGAYKLKFAPHQLYASRDGRRRRGNTVGSQRMTTSTTSPKTTALLRQPSIPAARYGWS